MCNNHDLRILSGLAPFFDFVGRYLIFSCFGPLLRSSLILFAATLMVSAACWYSLTCFFPVDLIWYSLIFVSGPLLSLNRINLAKLGNFGLFRRKTGQGIKRFPKDSPKRPISRSDAQLALCANRASKTASVSYSGAPKCDFSSCVNFWFLGCWRQHDVSSTADDVSLLT